jgi:cyclopropane-fatty-acyl-phospholipid synthase
MSSDIVSGDRQTIDDPATFQPRPARPAAGSARAGRGRIASKSEPLVRGLLAEAGVEAGGPNPWDPRIRPEAYDMIVAEGSIGLGEAYMHGLWECDDLAGLFARLTAVAIWNKVPANLSTALLYLQARLQNRQNKTRAMKVGRIHYDLPAEVWEATLDETMTGSCAYYRTGAETLEEAQAAKKRLVFGKLDLQPDQTLLDIGVGWGAFAGYAAQQHRARPVGVTISPVQRDYIHRRYGPDAVDVRVQDYRDIALAAPVDRIISVEMFEQVGWRNYRRFFEIARKALKPDGRMLLHTIVGHEPSWHIDPWMNKYIYPEGHLPTLGQIGAAVDGLFHIEDVQDIGAHYDPTLVAWMDKFRSNREAVKALGAGKLGRDPEVFCRMWEYHYLASAGGFRSRCISVHQYVLSPNGIEGGLPAYREA